MSPFRQARLGEATQSGDPNPYLKRPPGIPLRNAGAHRASPRTKCTPSSIAPDRPQANAERANAQKPLILKEREAYYTKGTLNTWMGTS